MVRARDLLDRFRPVGAPGPASLVGVPADRLGEVVAELEPIFALLEDVEQQCRHIREEAEWDARRRRSQAGAARDQAVALAREDAKAARAEEAGSARRRGEEVGRAAAEKAISEVAALHERTRARLPELVAVAVQIVRDGTMGSDEFPP
jgi:RNA 3'-terminal phosphate cyclase